MYRSAGIDSPIGTIWLTGENVTKKNNSPKIMGFERRTTPEIATPSRMRMSGAQTNSQAGRSPSCRGSGYRAAKRTGATSLTR